MNREENDNDEKNEKYNGDREETNDDIKDINLEEFKETANLYETIQNLSKTMKSFGDLASRIYPAIESFQNLSRSVAEVVSAIDYTAILDGFNRIRDVLLDGISAIQLPQFNEERKNELVSSYERWGQYGWTLNPVAPLKQLYSCPDNLRQANAEALRYCKDEIKIFEAIRESKRTKKDFDEAVYDFENKKYKSCALVLITIIESSIIRSQKKTRKVGKKAIENVEKRLEKIEIMGFYQMLMMTNYVSCLKKLFEGADNFKPQPDVINRNFLCHGMLWRDVRRIDCMKLFLVYYNTLQFLEILYS